MKTLGKLARIVGYLNASMVEGKVVKKRKVHGEDLCKEHFNIFQIFAFQNSNNYSYYTDGLSL